MLVRILTGVVGVPLAVVLIFFPGGLPFAVAMGAISVLGAMEFYRGVRKIGARPVEWAGLAAVLFFVVSATTFRYSDGTTVGAVFPTVLTLLLIASFCVEMVRTERAPILNVGTTVFGAIYVGWLISHLVVLRGVVLGPIPDTSMLHQAPPAPTVTVGSYHPEVGACLVMLAFVCTWACDTCAYFFGRAFGKTKIAPKLSPNKTIEGSIAGLVGTMVVAMLAGWVIDLPWYHGLALGAMFGVLSQLGDLSESSIKRELDMKDFGTIVPGHGGILDRFDSLLFTGPAAYYYAMLFLQHWPR
jgi:phosphatidate cytidylyltransferase